MLKTRVIPILLLKGNSVVKTIRFDEPRMVGDAITNVNIFSSRMADEMVIVDIEATNKNRINKALITKLAAACVMPLTIGGGINTMSDADAIFNCGADKVVINSHFYSRPGLLREIAKKFGSQAVVFSLDTKKVNGEHKAMSHGGKKNEDISAIEAAQESVSYGAGKILVNSVDLDGVMQGFDLKLIESVSCAVDVPIIAVGGCGSKEDCVAAIESGASAVAAGSIFFFIGESIISLKRHMKSSGIDVRNV